MNPHLAYFLLVMVYFNLTCFPTLSASLEVISRLEKDPILYGKNEEKANAKTTTPQIEDIGEENYFLKAMENDESTNSNPLFPTDGKGRKEECNCSFPETFYNTTTIMEFYAAVYHTKSIIQDYQARLYVFQFSTIIILIILFTEGFFRCVGWVEKCFSEKKSRENIKVRV